MKFKQYVLYEITVKQKFKNKRELINGKIILNSDKIVEVSDYLNKKYPQKMSYRRNVLGLSPYIFIKEIARNRLEDFRDGFLNLHTYIYLRKTELCEKSDNWIWYKMEEDDDIFNDLKILIRLYKLQRIIDD